ncbi:50S ribosomal protein L9 [Candidatus Wolfebacteria bacterium]|nr:50S ribosomal protein L9 [Candidatus Wolfebacteria bacterium]
MKIILLEDIKKLGKKFDVKDVSDGYARNFLIPKKMAKIATDSEVKNLEIKKSANEKKEQEIKQKLDSAAKNLANKEFIFKVKSGNKGEIFEPVGKEAIKNKILEDFSELKKYGNLEINLSKSIKILGEHSIEINFGKGIKGKIKIRLEPLS